MATTNECLLSDEEDIDSDQQYDLPRTVMFDQFSGVSDSTNSYGEGLRRTVESNLSVSSTNTCTPHSRLYTGWRRIEKYSIRFWDAFRRVVLPNITEWLCPTALGVLVAVLSYLFIYPLIQHYGTVHNRSLLPSNQFLGQFLIWIVILVVFICFLVGFCQDSPMNTLGNQVGPVGTRTVTDIVKGLPNRFHGIENLFMFCSFVEIPPEYGEIFVNESNKNAGKSLEMFIEGYLVHEKGFLWCKGNQEQPDLDRDNSIFGKVVWEVVKKIEPEADMAFMYPKMIEKRLKCYGVTGRADCIIRRHGKASIIIDFKYTKHSDQDELYKNPSRSFALQLLLYQWMAGKEFKEKEGAQLYIIRYYKGSNVMVLYQYQPPEDLQYSPAREEEYQPNVIDQVVENFKNSLQRHLENENEIETLLTLDTELQELQEGICRKLQF